ncbi:ABC transporter permease [Spirochaetia bacterium]|nr:ABC transporter permease [Spirochaetia bacterium]
MITGKHVTDIQSERQHMQILFLLPLLLAMVALILIPMGSLFGISFSNYKLTSAAFRMIGFRNYGDLLGDGNFRNAAKNSVIMVFWSVLLQMVLGVIAAMVIQRLRKLRAFVQMIIVVPMVVPPVIAGLIWRILLVPKYGGIDAFLLGFGITNGPAWLSEPFFALWTIILVSVWEWTPFVILFVIAALDSLPLSPFEAARIDGANFLQETFYLTLPLIRPILATVLIFRIVEGLKIFPLVYTLTQGGPGRYTEELTYFAYSEGFVKFKLGYASASSVMMFTVIIVLIVLFYGHITRKGKKPQ